jgi:hypothetical protein
VALGFTQADLDAADLRSVNRQFFVAGLVYGGKSDKVGKFATHKSGLYLFADNNGKRVEITPEEIEDFLAQQPADKKTLEIGKTYVIGGKIVKVENKMIIWSCAYFVNDKVQDGLSRSFLLTKGRFDHENKHIAPKGSVREWAQTNILSGVLEKSWCDKLAQILNERGLRFDEENYTMKAKDGRSFVATFLHPNFAE